MDNQRDLEHLKNYKPSIDDLKMKHPAVTFEINQTMKNRIAMPFTTEQEAIEWVRENIPLWIKPMRKRNYPLISPFKSDHSMKVVVERLGKELFKLIQK